MFLPGTLITVNENLTFNNQSYQRLLLNRHDHACDFRNYVAKPIELERYASTDKFNIKIPHMYNGDSHSSSEEPIAPYLNINNRLLVPQNTPSIQGDLREDFFWNMHHSTMGDLRFRDIDELVVGMNSGLFSPTPMLRRVMHSQFENIQKQVVGSFDNIIELKTISKVIFNNKLEDFSPVEGQEWDGVTKRTFDGQYQILYDHYFIKPVPTERFGSNQNVAEIYAYSDYDKQISFADIDVKDATLKTSSLKNSSLHMDLQKYEGNKKLLEDGEKPYLIGVLKITDPTYYDYQTQESKVGLSYNSNIGEQIPFNFKGNYTRELDFTLNSAFKDMKISFSKNMTQPVLGASNGLVQLRVIPSEQHTTKPLRFFDSDDIKLIRTNKYDLTGLMRLSHEA